MGTGPSPARLTQGLPCVPVRKPHSVATPGSSAHRVGGVVDSPRRRHSYTAFMLRRLRQLAICAILGIVATVAVAWGCAWFIHFNPYTPTVHTYVDFNRYRPGWQPQEQSCRGAHRVMCIGVSAGLWERDLSDESPDEAPNVPPVPSMPRWMRTDLTTPPDLHGSANFVVDDARGWPWLAMSARARRIHRDAISLEWGFEPRPDERINAPDGETVVWQTRILPLRPIWPNFMYSVLLYAGVAWLLIFAPFEARRLIRRRHDRCASCGYDQRGSASTRCPECGAIRV